MATPNLNAVLSNYPGGVKLPPHDYEAFTYVGSGAANDDLISTIIGYTGGSSGKVVGTLTFAYVGSTNNVLSITLTLPTANG